MNPTTHTDPIRNSHTPTHAEVAALAYHIYHEEGCPVGRSRAHWREAELHLRLQNHDSDLPMFTFSGNGNVPARRGVTGPLSTNKTPKRRSIG